MSDDLKLFAGGAILVIVFAVAGVWVKDFQVAASQAMSALIGAAAMKMKGNT